MWKVEVEEAKVETKSGVSARTGRPYSIREQTCWLYGYDDQAKAFKHAQKIKVTLADEQANAYPVGLYAVHPGSVYVDKFGQASLKVRLMPAGDFSAWVRNTFSQAKLAAA